MHLVYRNFEKIEDKNFFQGNSLVLTLLNGMKCGFYK